MKTRQRFLLGLGLGLALAGGASAADMGTAFTYQGLLEIDGVVVADETCDFLFKLYPELASGSQIGSTQTRNGVSVKDGLFIVTLDFASNNAFNGEARWLNIQVKCPPDGSFTELTPRQELTPTPYAIRAWEGVGPPNALEVDTTTGYVGIGTATPEHALHVEGSGERTIFGVANALTGDNVGVWGLSRSTSGRGVFGEALATSGVTYGGRFESRSTLGQGVLGWAIATSGVTYGGRFQSDSTSGRGVFGEATATSGTTYGGRFESDSTSGTGVLGRAGATSGTTYGVWGLNGSTSGSGVFGWATATSGVNFGVIGRSNSSDGFDFYASGAGTNYGSSSSRRWKSNIEPISDPLDNLAKLQGVYFDWDEEHGGHHDVGMIAEEVGKVLPEIVNYEENGVDAIGMDYSKLTPLLVEAVNALRAEKDSQIEAQQEQIAALRAELSEMKESIRKMTPSTRASALGMATPVLAAACLIGMVVMGRGRKGGAQ